MVRSAPGSGSLWPRWSTFFIQTQLYIHCAIQVLVDIAVMVQLPVDGSMPRLDRAMLLKEAEQWRLAGAAGLFVSPPPELPAPTCPPLSTDGPTVHSSPPPAPSCHLPQKLLHISLTAPHCLRRNRPKPVHKTGAPHPPAPPTFQFYHPLCRSRTIIN